MNDRYNIEVASAQEAIDRENYLTWISGKPECRHLTFAKDHWKSWDCTFISGDTICVCELKGRNYSYNYLITYGAEIDFSKARDIYNLAMSLEALPIVISFTSDHQAIVSDLRNSRNRDVQIKYYQNNNNNHEREHKKMLNLRNCTIK